MQNELGMAIWDEVALYSNRGPAMRDIVASNGNENENAICNKYTCLVLAWESYADEAV